MQKTITIPLKEYNSLKHRAHVLQSILEHDKLTLEELEKIKHAEKSKRLTKAEFYSKHSELME